MSQIFISYSRKDIGLAGKIVCALAEKDLGTWIDWKKSLQVQIEGTDQTLTVRNTNESIRHDFSTNHRGRIIRYLKLA